MGLSTRLAIESEPVTTDVIMVNLFPYLAIRHQVGNIPTTVVNGREKIGGPLDEESYLDRILAATGSPSDGTQVLRPVVETPCT